MTEQIIRKWIWTFSEEDRKSYFLNKVWSGQDTGSDYLKGENNLYWEQLGMGFDEW